MPNNYQSRPRWLAKLRGLESLIVPYFSYVAAVSALAVLVTLAIGELSSGFDTAIRPLYAAFTLLLVIEILRRIYSVNRPGPDTSKAAANQEEALQDLTEYIRSTSFQAKCEFSCMLAQSLTRSSGN